MKEMGLPLFRGGSRSGAGRSFGPFVAVPEANSLYFQSSDNLRAALRVTNP
jgi:hypothetical protein